MTPMNNMFERKCTKDRKQLFFLICASIFILYFIFSPALNTLYHTGEDLRYTFGGYNKTCASDDGFYFVMTLGRPLQGYMDCLSYKYGFSLEHMRIIRIFSVALMGCGMGLLADLLITLGIPFLISFFIAGGLFLLPRLYGDTVSLGATSLPFALLFIILAYRSLTKAHSTDHKKWYVISSFWILCSLLTYPAMTFFFGTLVLLKLLFSDLNSWQRIRKETLIDISIFILVCSVYFVYGYLNMHYNPTALVPDAYRIDHPNFNLIEIINRATPLANFFDGAWYLFPYNDQNTFGNILFILFAGGIGLALLYFIHSLFLNLNVKERVLTLLQAAIFTVATLILSSAFFLIMPVHDSLGSRLVFPSMAAGFTLLCWCIYQLSSLITWRPNKILSILTLGSLFIIAAYQANIFTMESALTSATTFNSLKTDIKKYIASGNKLKRIHYIISKTEYPYNRFFWTNGVLVELLGANNYEITWCSLPRGVAGEEKDHQKEMMDCIKKLTKNSIAVTYSYVDEPYTTTPSTLLLNHVL